MKQHYPNFFFSLAGILLLLLQPAGLTAQCTCSDGSPALTEVHNSSVTFPSNTTSTLTMPQFAPATGTLICVNAKISLTSVLRMKLENNDINPVDYLVRYTRSDTFSGPGINPSVYGNRTIGYGPYHLGPDDGMSFNPGGIDNVSIGPDTVYNKVLYQSNTSNVANYLGTGTVDFTYKSIVNTYAIGSDYYSLAVNSQNKVDFFLTYSYCSTAILKLNLKSFQAILKDKENVFLTWTTLTESKNNNYEIELSQDGSSFRTIGTSAAKSSDGAAAEYNYQYHPDQPAGGKLYFRIKQINGKSIAYSDLRIVNLGNDGFPGLKIYPNPVVRNVNLQFDSPISGDFRVELTNQVGQIVFATAKRISNTNELSLELKNPPAPGVYYLRARETASGKVYSGKLLFTR